MTTYKTLEAARQEAPKEAVCILEITHATEGWCFIAAKAPASVVKQFVRDGKLPEIARVLGEHPKADPAAFAEARKQEARARAYDNLHNEGCRGNYNPYRN